jgi:hypothetical protein
LLKKLCIHLYEKIKGGVEQNELIENKLDVSSLFDSDLKELAQAESACLKFIAQRAPVDWFEVTELSGGDVLNSLINRRLVVRSGDRLNIYWDIFREYILTEKVPIIPLRYLPSTDFTSIYKVASFLDHRSALSIQNLVDYSGFSEGTVQNICSDIYMFGIATRESGSYLLNEEIQEGNELKFLNVIRDKFKKHAFTLALKNRSSSSVISVNDAILALQTLYPDNSYAKKTWHSYTVRMCRWLELCGFILAYKNGWVYRDQGKVILDRLNSSRRRTNKLFTAPTSPALTRKALSWIIEQKSFPKNDKKPKGYNNAISILRRFDLVIVDDTYIYPSTEKIRKHTSLEESIWLEASKDSTLLDVLNLLKGNINTKPMDISEYLCSKYSLKWTDASKLRTGRALKQWSLWLYEGSSTSIIPECPGRA